MPSSVVPAATFKRTSLERSDQRVAWERSDEAFFAAGACHVLAYRCAAAHPAVPIGIRAMRRIDDGTVAHVVASWEGWLFGFNGWSLEPDLLEANEGFERIGLDLFPIEITIEDFCGQWYYRLPSQYHQDATYRADQYVRRFTAPFASESPSR
jgi:hypothetical protein